MPIPPLSGAFQPFAVLSDTFQHFMTFFLIFNLLPPLRDILLCWLHTYRSYTHIRHVSKPFRHLPALLDFIYPSAFWYFDILIVSSLFQHFHWSAYVIIVQTASQAH
jgi:hypothetical protein